MLPGVLKRARTALLALALALGLVGVASVAPASASSVILCRGYAGCAAAGYSSSGYSTAGSTMYWRMYSGHNCTNYAAYRMVKAGMPNERPWTGSGNATNWGVARSDITDQTPRVGAVAWWKAYVAPAGSAGHVAYVEKVISSTEIIVSQDAWNGDFSWARITKDSGGRWPSGFVHFKDVPLRNVATPTVSGTAKVGSALTATGGTWNPADATLTYQWRADGAAVSGATAKTFTPTTAQQGDRITVTVTAKRVGYAAATAVSAATAAVLPGQISSTAPPSVSGDPQVGGELTAAGGSWSPSPDALSYQWTADGTAVTGADDTTLPMSPELVGKKVAVKVTASKSGYPAVTKSSAATAAVAPGTFEVTRQPAVSGTPTFGQTLTLDRGAYTETPTVSVQWLRDGVPVTGATGTSYPLGVADVGHPVTARVTLTRSGYTTLPVTAPATAAVAPAVFTVTRAPAVTGVPKFGQTLTLDRGAATGTPTTTVEWLRDGVPVAGATGTTYSLGLDDIGKQVTARVTLARAGYTTQRLETQAGAPVEALAFTVTRRPAVSGSPRYGQTLTLQPGAYTGTPATRIQWLRGGVPVAGATGTSYRLTTADLGHHVWARVVLTRAGYTTQAPRSLWTPVVKSPSTLSVATTAGTGKVTVSAKVTAPGVAPVTGVVRVYDGAGHQLAEMPLSTGRATSTVKLPKGLRTVRVRYPWTSTVTDARVVKSVRIG